MKKKGIVILVTCALLLGIVVITHTIGGGKKPYKDLDATQITSATVRLLPPDKTVQITDTEELTEYLKDIVIHNEDNSYTEYSEQSVIFTLTMTDGVGYQTDYKPCEALNNYANKLLNQ